MNNGDYVGQLLRINLHHAWVKIHAELLDSLGQGFSVWTLNTNPPEEVEPELWTAYQLARYLQYQLNKWLEELRQMENHYSEFQHAHHNAPSETERLEHVATITERLGYSRQAISKIRGGRAEWFDENAIFDCYSHRRSRIEQHVSVCLERLGHLLSLLVRQTSAKFAERIWKALEIHGFLQQPLQYRGSIQIRNSAFRCLSLGLAALPNNHEKLVPANIRQFIFHACIDENSHLWLRAEGLNLLAQIAPRQFQLVYQRLFAEGNNTDFFLRGAAVRQVCQHYDRLEDAEALLQDALNDPDDYVRQRLAENCPWMPEAQRQRYFTLSATDTRPRVRAQAYLALARFRMGPTPIEDNCAQVLDYLPREQDTFALRTLMHVMAELFNDEHYETPRGRIFTRSMALLTEMNISHADTGVRRWAAQCREAIWQARYRNLLPPMSRRQLRELMLHQRKRVEIPARLDREKLYRYLAQCGAERYGYDIRQRGDKLRITAGYRFRFRTWRFIHEWLNPATDKRQNHDHMKGRVYYGLTQTAGNRMAENSMTKVPGEPLHIEDEKGWRGYLPLLDQVLSSLDQNWPTRPVEIYSSEGITEIHPPTGLWRRLRARLVLQRRFAQIAALRNWRESDSHPASRYLEILQGLGFRFSIRGYLDHWNKPLPVDDRVQRFFPSLGLPFVLPSWGEAQSYFYSVYQNTIQQLLVFTLAVTGVTLGRHSYLLMQLNRARRQIPLVVGGWGSRGKSGTERLKAALFNALGMRVMSKTTGCEAMFLYGAASRPMKELFLFRPYDKATIWEQVSLTRLSSKLGTDVFLWECMGLTPRYIDILQNQWMRDDLATITNCYPDHEDLQGPAGIEIPIVMQRFVPRASVLVTTEDSMAPLLEDAAMTKNTEYHRVTWLEAGLITDDVIERFPYEEHPNNIALVAKLGAQIGVRRDFTLQAMADNVVADLGVLKIYPDTWARQRRFQFINGMSANERLAALGNWQRTGLADHQLETDPGTWLSIVVNNRADRVSRSKVFAAMLVNDMQADRYYFIGNNLTGLQSYIEEAWEDYARDMDFSADSDGELFTREAARFRIPVNDTQVNGRIRAILEGLNIDDSLREPLLASVPANLSTEEAANWQPDFPEGIDGDAITSLYRMDVEEYLQFQRHRETLKGGTGNSKTLADWLLERFRSRWVTVSDYYSTGNQTLSTIIDHTPPGIYCRMIGVQNIKGTGLDFIYRWQAWDQVWQLCETLENSGDTELLENAAKALASWEEYGLLDETRVQHMLEVVNQRRETQRETMQADIRMIENRLQGQLESVRASLEQSSDQSSRWARVINFLEAFLDSGDAVKRRKHADRIYQALLDNLISYDRAAIELAAVVKAQKGGWLVKRLQKYLPQGR